MVATPGPSSCKPPLCFEVKTPLRDRFENIRITTTSSSEHALLIISPKKLPSPSLRPSTRMILLSSYRTAAYSLFTLHAAAQHTCLVRHNMWSSSTVMSKRRVSSQTMGRRQRYFGSSCRGSTVWKWSGGRTHKAALELSLVVHLCSEPEKCTSRYVSDLYHLQSQIKVIGHSAHMQIWK